MFVFINDGEKSPCHVSSWCIPTTPLRAFFDLETDGESGDILTELGTRSAVHDVMTVVFQ